MNENMKRQEGAIFTRYFTESTSPTSSKVNSIILAKTTKTRRILRPTIVKKEGKPEACLKIELTYERAGKNGFETVKPPNLAKLKSEESLSCSLSSEETLELYKELSRLYALGEQSGVQNGKHRFIVFKTSNDVFLSDSDEKSLIQLLNKCQCSPGLAEKLASTNPELIENAYHYRSLQKKRDGITKFKIMLTQICSEQKWQDFFEEHSWILEGLSDVQILKKQVEQPIFTGADVEGKNEKRGDFLLSTQGNIKFSVLAEIKRPDTHLLKQVKFPYRLGAYQIGDEISGSFSQLRTYLYEWETEGSKTKRNLKLMASQRVYTIRPRGVLIAGHLKELDCEEKIESFELFRQNQLDIKVFTFDEVYQRAEYLVGID